MFNSSHYWTFFYNKKCTIINTLNSINYKNSGNLFSLLLYKYLHTCYISTYIVSQITSWLTKPIIFTVTMYKKNLPPLRLGQLVKFIYFTYCFLLTSSYIKLEGHCFCEFPNTGREWVTSSKEKRHWNLYLTKQNSRDNKDSKGSSFQMRKIQLDQEFKEI